MDLAQEKKYSEHLYGFTCDEPRKNHVSNWAIDDVDAESAQIHHITSPCLHPPRGREASQTSNPSIWCNGRSYADT